MARIVIPPPPRLQGPAEEQIGQLSNYAQQLYGALVEVARAVVAVGAVPEYEIVVSDPPTQGEMVILAETVNAVIDAAGGVTL